MFGAIRKRLSWDHPFSLVLSYFIAHNDAKGSGHKFSQQYPCCPHSGFLAGCLSNLGIPKTHRGPDLGYTVGYFEIYSQFSLTWTLQLEWHGTERYPPCFKKSGRFLWRACCRFDHIISAVWPPFAACFSGTTRDNIIWVVLKHIKHITLPTDFESWKNLDASIRYFSVSILVRKNIQISSHVKATAIFVLCLCIHCSQGLFHLEPILKTFQIYMFNMWIYAFISLYFSENSTFFL